MVELDYQKAVDNKISHVHKSIGYVDRFRKYTLDEAWAQKKTEELKATGILKLKAMLIKVEELGYNISRVSIKDFGLVFLNAEREGTPLAGYVDPNGKLVLGIKGTRTPVLKMCYRKKLGYKDNFLGAILQDSGFRRKGSRLEYL